MRKVKKNQICQLFIFVVDEVDSSKPISSSLHTSVYASLEIFLEFDSLFTTIKLIDENREER